MKHFKLVLTLFQIAVAFCSSSEEKRKISRTTHCGNDSSTVTHIEAAGHSDSLHYLLSTWKIPSGFVARTEVSVNISIDCEKFKRINSTDNSISFTKDPLFFYGFSFSKLYEYDDVNDTADVSKLTDKTIWNVTDFASSNVTWTSEYNETTHILQYKVSQNCTTLKIQENGQLSFSFQFHTENGEADLLPHLQYNANITQMHMKFDRLIPLYPESRYVLEMNLVSIDMNKSKVSDELSVHKSLDDEHTPGVFQIIDWQSSDTSEGSFLQWKPVCYTWDPHSIANSTLVRQYGVVNSSLPAAFRLAHGYFGKNSSHVYVKATNVSFGLSKDKFYAQNNYTSWTVNIGYGLPPEEKVSVLIILIISIGLGIPVILIIGGSISVCVRRKKQQQGQFTSSYSKIQ